MDKDMLETAKAAMGRAHAPYSNFKVGAAIRGASGKIYGGCNVENASYPEGWCAEASAIAAMIMAGERDITEVCVFADSPAPITPCGGCRQRLAEFAQGSAPVHSAGSQGWRATWTLAELLPASFSLAEKSG